MKTINESWKDGINAVRLRPNYPPTNPYDDVTQSDLYEAWETGAIDAGICEIYNNGVLVK